MGSKVFMSKSIQIGANFIGKFHNEVSLQAMNTEVQVFPVMDGAYVISRSQHAILGFISILLKALTDGFVKENELRHKFIVRDALSYGPIYNGNDIPVDAFCPEQAGNQRRESIDKYKGSLLFGLPMIQAFNSEINAPPFGIYIHESARLFHQIVNAHYARYGMIGFAIRLFVTVPMLYQN